MLQYVFFLLAIQCLNVASLNDFRLNETVIPPYRTAVTLLNKDIVDKLIKIDLIRDNHLLSNLAHELYCTTQEICANLKQATAANDALSRQISLRIAELYDSIAKSENKTMQMRTNLKQLNNSIHNARIQVRDAEDAVRHKQQQYDAAVSDHQKAEQALRNARVCTRRRRKRWGWWRKNVENKVVTGWQNNVERPVVNGWEHHVIKPLCSVINHQGIQNAKSRVSTTRGSLNEATNTLSKFRRELQNEMSKYTDAQSQFTISQQKLTSLNVILNQQRAAQTVATTLQEQFRAIEVHLDGISGPSMQLLDQLEMLTAFEAVIEPLNGIYKELLSERMIEPETLQISPRKINEIKRKLKLLAEKLPEKEPFEIVSQGPCRQTTTPLSVTSDMEMDFDELDEDPWGNETTWPEESEEIEGYRFRRAVSNSETTELAELDKAVDLSSIKKQLIIDQQYEDTLVTAPSTIFLLGKLMVFSSKRDFSLLTYSTNWTYTRLRNPQSFRATLAQIANDGWQAFMGAHSAMNKIQLYMQQIPRHIQIARKLIAANVSYELLARLLPKSLKHLSRIGEECVSLAANTRNAFSDVHKLLQDVEEATLASKGGHEAELVAVRNLKNLTAIALAQKEESKKELDQEVSEAKEAVRNARSELSNALSKIPTGMEAVLYDFCNAVTGLISDIGKAVSGKGMSQAFSANKFALKNGVPFVVSETLALINGYGDSVKSVIDTMAKTGKLTSAQLTSFKTTFEFWSNMLMKTADNAIKNEASSLVQRGISTIAKMTKTGKDTGEVAEADKQQLNTLVDDIKKYQAAQELATAGDPMSQVTSSNVPSSTGNAKYIVGVRQDELRAVEKIYESRYAERRKLMNDMHDLLLRIAKLNMDEIQYKEIVEILHKAIELLAIIKENWNDLVLFFSTIADGIEVAISSILTPFIEHAGEVKLSYNFANDRAYLLESIVQQGKDVQDEARLIFLVSRTYVDVSTKFLMKKLAGLSRLTLITDDHKRIQMLEDLQQQEKQVEKEVRELVSARRRLFQEQVSQQRMQLEAMAEQFGDGDQDDHEAIVEGKKLLAKLG